MIQLKATTYKVMDYDKKGTVIIMPNSFNIEDDQGDISLKGSFTKAINENFTRWGFLFAHDPLRKIGEPLEAWETKQGLQVKAVLNLNKEDGRNTYEDYKLAAEYGRTVEHSMAVGVVKSYGNAPKFVTEWRVKEVSYIPLWGSNPNTPLIALKGEDEQYVQYCIKNGSHTDCYLKKYESLIEAGQPLHQADDLTEFINLLKF